ncbi:hypothetical protein E2562_001020 [Oryza meyeriana var. granulata]|uniref:Uncharacterized protein n=1 Tax=Oryza meyeriana var. granulata TaxID=110450 RepID=A0A6G1ED61_9ORYZ|nr:hypothetical protein E2562_001020 [Oryza meyeriana var. granulata]
MPKANKETSAFDDMGTSAGRNILEVTSFDHARVDEFHEKIEKNKAEEEKAVVDVEEDDYDIVSPPPLSATHLKTMVV